MAVFPRMGLSSTVRESSYSCKTRIPERYSSTGYVCGAGTYGFSRLP